MDFSNSKIIEKGLNYESIGGIKTPEILIVSDEFNNWVSIWM